MTEPKIQENSETFDRVSGFLKVSVVMPIKMATIDGFM